MCDVIVYGLVVRGHVRVPCGCGQGGLPIINLCVLSFGVGSSGVTTPFRLKIAGRDVCHPCHVAHLMCDVIVLGLVVRDHVLSR